MKPFEPTIERALSYQVTSRPHEVQPDRASIARPAIKINLKKRTSSAYMPLPTPSDINRFKSAPYRKGKRPSIEDLEPLKTSETKKEPSKVFQGRQMREEASLLSKIFFSYPKPLLDAAMGERITFD